MNQLSVPFLVCACAAAHELQHVHISRLVFSCIGISSFRCSDSALSTCSLANRHPAELQSHPTLRVCTRTCARAALVHFEPHKWALIRTPGLSSCWCHENLHKVCQTCERKLRNPVQVGQNG